MVTPDELRRLTDGLHQADMVCEWYVDTDKAVRALRECAVLVDAAPKVTPDTMHEMCAHLPFDLADKGPEKWEWMANWINRAMAHPGVPCPCCKTTPLGDVYDHLSQEQIEAMQSNT